VFVVEGAASVCCSRDLYISLCFVLASLDRASVRVLSPLGMCCNFTSSKPDFMILRTRW